MHFDPINYASTCAGQVNCLINITQSQNLSHAWVLNVKRVTGMQAGANAKREICCSFDNGQNKNSIIPSWLEQGANSIAVLILVISKNSHLYYVLETYTSASTHAKLTKKVTEKNNSSREQVSLTFVSTNWLNTGKTSKFVRVFNR